MGIRMTATFGMRVLLVLVCLAQGCGRKPTHSPANYSKEPSIRITVGKTATSFGLTQSRLEGDGITTAARMGGQDCQRLRPEKALSDSYIYFKVDPTFKSSNSMNLKATVEYFDATPCNFFIEFDGWDSQAKHDGAYSRSEERVRLAGDQQWKMAEFTLKNCRLANRQNGGSDVRIRAANSEFFVRSMTIERE
jgi:hypothetical protein